MCIKTFMKFIKLKNNKTTQKKEMKESSTEWNQIIDKQGKRRMKEKEIKNV